MKRHGWVIGTRPEEVVIKTGFGAVRHNLFSLPMPDVRAWEIDTFEKLETCRFDDPRDRRRVGKWRALRNNLEPSLETDWTNQRTKHAINSSTFHS